MIDVVWPHRPERGSSQRPWMMLEIISVEEALAVNEELSAVEEQIEQVQGRMNYLFV
jgi:hypothetical protein